MAIEKTGVKAKKGTAAQKIAEQSKKEYGVETVVVPDDVWNDAFGDDQGNIPEAGRSYGGKIYVQEGISEEDRALAVPHETTHIMRQQEFKPFYPAAILYIRAGKQAQHL